MVEEIKCAKIKILSTGIIHIEYKSEYQIELEDVIEVEKVYKSLAQENDVYSVMNSNGKFISMTKDAQGFLANEASIVPKIKGSAVVLDNLPTRILVRSFIVFHKPLFPTKIFKHEESAIKWLLSLKQVNS